MPADDREESGVATRVDKPNTDSGRRPLGVFNPKELVANRYRIVRLIAHGGMGDVYEAFDQELRTPVALKTIRGLATERAAERFRREIYLARKVTHPNVCRLFDIGRHETDGRDVLFITMELLDGESLAERIKREGKLSTVEALPIIRDICAAVSAAHAEGIIHRDLKPGNVMLSRREGTSELRAIVTDFGVAHGAGDPYGDLSGTGDVVGSPAYMAPEQLEGAKATTRADVYALGIVLYEMVTGLRPFVGESSLSAVIKRLKVNPEPPTTHVPDLDPRWEAAILHCLERDPARRFATPDELISGLTGEGGGPTIVTTRPTPKRRTRAAMFTIAGTLGVVALGAAAWSLIRSHHTSSAGTSSKNGRRSIAVLPFTDMSQAKDQQYFSDGLSETLLETLARLPQLQVASRTSSFSFKNQNADTATIGHTLHVDTLLEGTVRKEGDRLRISVHLVSVSDGFELWSETFDRNVTDVFAVQDEIANAVADALKVKLLPEQVTERTKHRTTNTEAYTQVLRGRELLSGSNAADFKNAVEIFNKAIALDPSYGAAYAGLAAAEFAARDYLTDPASADAATSRALAAADKAVELDPELPIAFAMRGELRYALLWDWTGAREDFKRAIELDPSDSATQRHYSALLATIGQHTEAIAAARRATEIDPLSAPAWNTLGTIFMSAKQFVNARAALNRALELNPRSDYATFNLGRVELLDRHFDKALDLMKRSHETFEGPGTAMAEFSLGHKDAATRALEGSIKTEADGAAYQIAEAYAWFGDADQAFKWLEHARDVRDGGLSELTWDRLFDSVRTDPRYSRYLESLRHH